MKPQELERWQKARQKGMVMYVLVSGVASYGIPMFIIMTFLLHQTKLSVGLSAALWLSAGAFYGITMWIVQERRYRKANVGS
jgi:hypothetical protein